MKHLAWGALVLFASTAAFAGEDLIQNGGFESGEDGNFPGWNRVWPPFLKESPRFGGSQGEPHGGKGAGSIKIDGGAGGYSSFTQVIEDPPKDAKVARLEGWVRAEKGTAASFILIFFDPENPKEEKFHPSPKAPDSGSWAKVELEALVPEGAKKWMVRCGVAGAGLAAFDDLSLTWSSEKLDPVETVLAVGHGKYFIVPSGAGREASIVFSIPFPFGGQTPFALRVETDPPDAVVRLEVRKDRDNRPLRVTVKSQAKRPIKIRADTFALLRDRPVTDGAGIALAPPEKVPPEVRVHLREAPGVDSSDRRVKEIAGKLPRKDLKALAGGLCEFLKGNLKYEGGGDQGSRRSIETKQAVCTGYANVAAALLIAAGVPARILPCTGIDGKLQEHYIVEAWAPGPGWARIESTMAVFPWPDSRNLILRVVYPESKRSPAHVPLFFELQGAEKGGLDGDPADGCWQSAETLGRFLLDSKEVEALEGAARKAFEASVAKPAPGSRIRFAPEAKALPALGDRGRRLLEALERESGG